MLQGRRVLLVIAGGIAAYKSLDLIRRLRERGASVRVVMTAAAKQFVTPLSAAALSGEQVYDDLFSLTDESEMGHLRLAQEADLVVVAPATADLLAKMAAGLADDLASTALLATDRPVLVAPAMNTRMWEHAGDPGQSRPAGGARHPPGRPRHRPAGRGRNRHGPHGRAAGDRRRDRSDCSALSARCRAAARSSPAGRRTSRSIPCAIIANRSSGKQGHAIAAALARLGAATVLVVRPDRRARSARRHGRAGRRPRARCWRPARRRCRPISRSAPRRWPTGASRRRRRS